MRDAFGFFTVFALVCAGLILGIGFFFPGLLPNSDDRGQFVFLIILVTLIGSGIVGSTRAQISLALRQSLIWFGIFLALVTLYAYRDNFSAISTRVQAELVPARPVRMEDEKGHKTSNVVALVKSADGHFWAQGKVNGHSIRFMVDTGASTVTLTMVDARRVGYRKKDLRFVVPVSTAAGQVMGAPIRLEKLSIGGIVLRDVDALVLPKGLQTSLLGMSYLGRLSRFEASKNQLILRR